MRGAKSSPRSRGNKPSASSALGWELLDLEDNTKKDKSCLVVATYRHLKHGVSFSSVRPIYFQHLVHNGFGLDKHQQSKRFIYGLLLTVFGTHI